MRWLLLALALAASCALAQTNNFNILDGSPLKATTIQVGDGTAAAPSIAFANETGLGLFRSSAAVLTITRANTNRISFDYSGGGGLPTGGLRLNNADAYSWSSTDAIGTSDLTLYRDAANTLAQRNSTNAQRGRWYNTFTNSSNGEWAEIDWQTNANVATLTTRANGSGTLRPLVVQTSAPNTQTGATYTVAAGDNWLIANVASTQTLTLPAPSASNTGRAITVKTIQAQTVVSASSNVVPCAGGSAGTAILAATAGKWATMVSDGSNWVIMACN